MLHDDQVLGESFGLSDVFLVVAVAAGCDSFDSGGFGLSSGFTEFFSELGFAPSDLVPDALSSGWFGALLPAAGEPAFGF